MFSSVRAGLARDREPESTHVALSPADLPFLRKSSLRTDSLGDEPARSGLPHASRPRLRPAPRAPAPDPGVPRRARPLVAGRRASEPALRGARREGPPPRGLRRDDPSRRRPARRPRRRRGSAPEPAREHEALSRPPATPRGARPRRARDRRLGDGLDAPRGDGADARSCPTGRRAARSAAGSSSRSSSRTRGSCSTSRGLPFTQRYDFLPEGPGTFGAVCGGTATVLLEIARAGAAPPRRRRRPLRPRARAHGRLRGLVGHRRGRAARAARPRRVSRGRRARPREGGLLGPPAARPGRLRRARLARPRDGRARVPAAARRPRRLPRDDGEQREEEGPLRRAAPGGLGRGRARDARRARSASTSAPSRRRRSRSRSSPSSSRSRRGEPDASAQRAAPAAPFFAYVPSKTTDHDDPPSGDDCQSWRTRPSGWRSQRDLVEDLAPRLAADRALRRGGSSCRPRGRPRGRGARPGSPATSGAISGRRRSSR